MSMNHFMTEVGKHSVMSREVEAAEFTRLQTLNNELISEMNRTAIFYNKIPSILILLADGYEAVKNIIQPHKHDMKTKQLTDHVISTLQYYQHVYQQYVITRNSDLSIELDNITYKLFFDAGYVIQLANEIRMYNNYDSLIDLHVTSEQLDGIQTLIVHKLKEIKQIRDRIVACNLRLVIANARKYYRDTGHAQMEDLIQEGNIGLMNAVERFDVSTGNKFSTVATWWIRQAIIRSLQNGSRTIRLPVNVQDHLNKLVLVTSQLEQRYKRAPTEKEIMTELGISAERYRELQSANTFVTSIDAPAGNDDESTLTLADVIADVASAADIEIYDEQLQRMIKLSLERLNNTERDVIMMRYGFDDEPLTLGECAVVLGCTKPTVMNYENRALLKLHRFLCEDLNYQE